MYLLIINPKSGNGNALPLWNEVEIKLKQQKVIYSSLISNSEAATQKFISNHLIVNKITAVAVLGGDGTTSSVIQEIAETDIPVAILPTGSGNDTARTFRLTADPENFVKGLLNMRSTTIDLLNINGRFGITIAGVGVDAIIGDRVNRSFYKPILNKLGIGSFAYTIAAVLTLLTFKSFTAKLTIDGQDDALNKAWLTAIGNTSSYGGGLVVCPEALPTDGILNITSLHSVSRMTILLQLFPSLLRGVPIAHRGVSYKKGKHVIIETNRPVPVIIDGEIMSTTPIEINIHDNALKLILTT